MVERYKFLYKKDGVLEIRVIFVMENGILYIVKKMFEKKRG